jgi:type IV secretory pathway component VirB8
MRDTKAVAAEKKRRAFWPVLGFLMLVALVGISYFAGPEVVRWLDVNNVIRGFPPPASEAPRSQINLIVSAIIFVVLAMFASLIVAATLPKKKTVVNEKMLAKERAEKVHAAKVRKMRQKALNQQGRSR